MGQHKMGIPEAEAEFIKKAFDLDTFVEGGTFKGETSKAMSSQFSKVYTIENSDYCYAIAKENLSNYSNVELLKGDTRTHLKSIVKDNDNMLFWLDAHWSGGETYGEEDECPLIEELKIIYDSKKHFVILIDDARLFAAPPPSPHKIEHWPTISDISRSIPKDWDVLIYEDVFYLLDGKNPKTHDFKEYLQSKIIHKKPQSTIESLTDNIQKRVKKIANK